MMIRANVRYDEWTNRLFYRTFQVVERLPECKKINEIRIDTQNNDDAFDFMYFECIDDDGKEFYAINKYNEKDVTVKGYPSNIDIFIYEYNPFTGEDDRYDFFFDTDGLEFEDDDDVTDFIYDTIIFKLQENVCLSESNIMEIANECSIILNSKIA